MNIILILLSSKADVPSIRIRSAMAIGGVIVINDAHFTDIDSIYYGNMAHGGGVFTLYHGCVVHIMIASTSMNNSAEENGGVL